MDTGSVDSLCIRILNKLKEQREVRDEQISLFLKLSLKIIESSDVPELPRSFFLLRENVYKCWIYEKIDELDANQAFVYGNLWGALKLIEIAEKSRVNRRSLDSLASQYEKNRCVFEIMNNKPGIMHKELAKLSNKTPSELSQFLSKIKEEQLFYDVRLGREKYYYLEERGISLLNRMKKQAEDKLNDGLQFSYWDIKNDNLIIKTKFSYAGEFDEKIKFQREAEHLLNNPKYEYVKRLKNNRYIIFSELEEKTVYKRRMEQNDVRINHYFTVSSEFDKTFEASIKSPNSTSTGSEIEFQEEVGLSSIMINMV